MSPGATFERVYNELKRMLVEGELPPGTPIEPALIGKQIASSITPVRDALHRLTGERLVEAPNHNGFRVPLLTEAALRDLYDWNGRLLKLAIRQTQPVAAQFFEFAPSPSEDIGSRTAAFFAEIARATGSAEHVQAIDQLSDRLGPFRRAEERVFTDIVEEFAMLWKLYYKADFGSFAAPFARYHRRRLRAVPEIVTSLGIG